MILNKKSQHEIVGLVAIVVIVAVMGVILLSFMIGRGSDAEFSSAEMTDFLQSVMYVTTDCAVSYAPQYDNIEDLIKSCYQGEKCIDGRDTCNVLNSSLSEIVSSGLNAGNVNKGYQLSIVYDDSNINEEVIPILKDGGFSECSAKTGASYVIVSPGFSSGKINVGLEVCRD